MYKHRDFTHRTLRALFNEAPSSKAWTVPTENHSSDSRSRPPRSSVTNSVLSCEPHCLVEEEARLIWVGWTLWGKFRLVQFPSVPSSLQPASSGQVSSKERAAELEQITWFKPRFWHIIQAHKKENVLKKKRLLIGTLGSHHSSREKCQNTQFHSTVKNSNFRNTPLEHLSYNRKYTFLYPCSGSAQPSL